MKHLACCRTEEAGTIRRLPQALGLLFSGAMVLLVPKCPVCLAAQVALVTGVGLSIPAASQLRLGLLFTLLAVFLAFGLACFRRWRRRI